MKIPIEEALRYAGVTGDAPLELRDAVIQLARQLDAELTPRWVCRVFPLERQSDGFSLGGTDIILTGHSAETMLAECTHAILLACTAGAEFDAMLRSEQARDMSRALLMDACGSAFVEAVCDAAEQEIAARFPDRFLTDRFSPGYGDLPLELQPAICSVLDTPRRIGVTVGPSLLMTPCKSVTAVIGIADRPQAARVRGCGYCSRRETCILRKGGHSCAI